MTALALLAALALLRGRASAAVTLSSFTGQWQGDQVVLNWTTATELDNLGFNILRAAPPEGQFEVINPALIPANCPGQPICLNPNYTFTDSTASPGQAYWYRVESVSLSNQRVAEDPLLCVAPPGMTCLPATATATITATPSATQPSATATPAATEAQPPAPSGGGQGAPTLLSPASATPSQAAPQAASNTPAPTATAPPQSGAPREPTRTPPAQPAQPAGALSGGAGAAAAGDENQEAPSPTPSAATEAPRPSPTAAEPGGAALPTRLVFPTATLAPTSTAALVAEAPGDAPSLPAASGAGGALQPAGPPWAAGQTLLIVLALFGLASLSFLGYFIRRHGRR